MLLAHKREYTEGPHTEAEQRVSGQSQQREAERENSQREAEERAAATTARQQHLQ